ncbi:hypothetical protein Moror_15532 [Moniliophthora roreri MCA 2997]|uniref:Uncharacterized protein n=1 Tax=Moniliophthora roreri (strain MCA 2997) TaxID=1381753 RepID=V2WJI5_MONRO|nr:hypothetical protein Moror_15532 [Moniliophthora roreri MCA 2997]
MNLAYHTGVLWGSMLAALLKTPIQLILLGIILYFHQQTINQQLLDSGLTCRFDGAETERAFAKTTISSHIPHLSIFSEREHSVGKFWRAQQLILPNGDRCLSNSFVITQTPSPLAPSSQAQVLPSWPVMPPTLDMAHVQEILQIRRLLQPGRKEADCVLAEILQIGPDVSVHGMPQLVSHNPKKYIAADPEVGQLHKMRMFIELILTQNVLCVVNVQHDCIRNKCPTKDTTVVRQEREDTILRQECVEHVGNPCNYVLNTAQMCSAKFLQCFRVSAPTFDTEKILMESVKREFEAQQKRVRVKAPNPTVALQVSSSASRPLPSVSEPSPGAHHSLPVPRQCDVTSHRSRPLRSSMVEITPHPAH